MLQLLGIRGYLGERDYLAGVASFGVCSGRRQGEQFLTSSLILPLEACYDRGNHFSC